MTRVCTTSALIACLLAAVGVAPSRAQADASTLRHTLDAAHASVLMMDVASGRVLQKFGDVHAQAAPGSTVKPLVLRAALENGAVGERTTVHCLGTLRVAGHNLACVHPRDVTVLDARQALAESCNTYFAMVARRLTAAQLVAALRGDSARAQGLQVRSAPADADQRELLGLGLQGVRATVLQMAEAYRDLALWMAKDGASARVVRDGMVASVETGVAHAAHVDGLTVAGKTGTVDASTSGRSQGWFAGMVYGANRQPARVLVVYVPNGNGRDAAVLAREALLERR